MRGPVAADMGPLCVALGSPDLRRAGTGAGGACGAAGDCRGGATPGTDRAQRRRRGGPAECGRAVGAGGGGGGRGGIHVGGEGGRCGTGAQGCVSWSMEGGPARLHPNGRPQMRDVPFALRKWKSIAGGGGGGLGSPFPEPPPPFGRGAVGQWSPFLGTTPPPLLIGAPAVGPLQEVSGRVSLLHRGLWMAPLRGTFLCRIGLAALSPNPPIKSLRGAPRAPRCFSVLHHPFAPRRFWSAAG